MSVYENILREIITHDKEYFNYIAENYPTIIFKLGHAIAKGLSSIKVCTFYCQEAIDYFDGNGFTIEPTGKNGEVKIQILQT